MAADDQEDGNTRFLEILCKSSGKIRRFAAGTTAEWALQVMNKKLDPELAQGFLLAAIKEGEGEGEEPVFFGPSSVLANYGKEWRLQTFTEEDLADGRKSAGMVPHASEKFMEVKCRRTGKTWRFAAGTRANHALLHMNKSLALGIEAVKEGEEAIKFGPEAFLTNFGPGWSLQTIFREGHEQERRMPTRGQRNLDQEEVPNSEESGRLSTGHITPGYIGRTLLAFVLLFLLGGILTVFLEYLPQLLAFFFSPS